MQKTNNKLLFIGIGILILLLLIVGWYVGTYNALISADQNVKNSWSNVEVQYQRRIDLIPNLISTVKGYMTYEQNLLINVTALRTQWMSAKTQDEKVSTANQIESALKTIFAVSENYPNLKADIQFTALMDELAGTENRISVERMKYNSAVKDYNNLVKFIPSNIVAGMMGYTEKSMFEAVSGAEVVPKVVI